MFRKTYLKQPGRELPALERGESRVIVADNGLFLERRTEMFTTCSRAGPQDLKLETHHEFCRLSCGKLPRVHHRAMLGFFQYAHGLHGGEAALILLYHLGRPKTPWMALRGPIFSFMRHGPPLLPFSTRNLGRVAMPCYATGKGLRVLTQAGIRSVPSS